MQKIQSEGSRTKYENTLKTINQATGSTFKPVEMETMKLSESPVPSGMSVSLAAARALPINKGKTDAEIRADIESHGHKVIE